MAIGLFFFGANIVALTANLLTGAGLLVSSPRSFNARVFAGVTVSAACYLVGRLSYAVPPDVQVSFSAVAVLTGPHESGHGVLDDPRVLVISGTSANASRAG